MQTKPWKDPYLRGRTLHRFGKIATAFKTPQPRVPILLPEFKVPNSGAPSGHPSLFRRIHSRRHRCRVIWPEFAAAYAVCWSTLHQTFFHFDLYWQTALWTFRISLVAPQSHHRDTQYWMCVWKWGCGGSIYLSSNTAYALTSIFGRHCASGLWKRVKDEWIVDERLKPRSKKARIKTTFWDWSVKTLIKTVLKTDEKGRV